MQLIGRKIVVEDPLKGECFLDPEEVVAQMAHQYGVSLAELRGPSRLRSMVTLRRVIAAALISAGMTYVEIGELLNRDHATVFQGLSGKKA